MIRINIKNIGIVEAKKGISLLELSKQYILNTKLPILLAKVDQIPIDLTLPVVHDCLVEFLDISDKNGFRAYQRSVVFLMIYAAKTILGKETRVIIEHSINKNYYCEIPDMKLELTEDFLKSLETKMKEIVAESIPIEKLSLSVEEAINISSKFTMGDKIKNLGYRRSSSVNFYKLNWLYDYFYGPMLPNTSLMKNFKLSKRSKGFMLQFPSAENDFEVADIQSLENISEVFEESNAWGRILNIDTVGALNDLICTGKLGDIIRISEALHEKKIAYLADRIHNENRSVVLIAGPSSSGKTTFASRLCVQLRVNGLRPHVISLDNYYLSREQSPIDNEGISDYEAVEALDIEQINNDLAALVAGESVNLPTFNFRKGMREYNGQVLRLSDCDVLVVEGLHGLNDRLTEKIPRNKKCKIFISALTQVNIDDHNRIHTTDTRLIRRIVRDYQFRAADANTTINMWPSVLRGENRNIFPFQKDADAFFNSALVYEMCVLKQYAEPLLFNVAPDQPAYTEARRLIKFLDSFLGVSGEQVIANSILREFIGGSCFDH